jgi:hypothetical protein
LQAVDTALLKLYVILRHSSLEDFCDAPNECAIQDAQSLLLEHKRFQSLAMLLQVRAFTRWRCCCRCCSSLYVLLFPSSHSRMLLQGKGLEREALEVWQKMGIGEYMETGLNGVAPTVALLSQCGHTAKEQVRAACELCACMSIILVSPPPPPPSPPPPQELVWVFSFWVLQKYPLEGLKIFTAGHLSDDVFGRASSSRSQQLSRARATGVTTEGASPLPPSRVLQHLESFEGHSKSLCVAYLEDLIYVQRKKYGRKEGAEEEFHTRLANEYIDTATMLIDAGVAVDKRSSSSAPNPGEDPGTTELRQVRSKLVKFLRTSDEYDAKKLLARIRSAIKCLIPSQSRTASILHPPHRTTPALPSTHLPHSSCPRLSQPPDFQDHTAAA